MVWNFSAGPARLPAAVLERVQAELLDWNGTGCSVMELSHRGTPFMDLARSSEARLRALAAIPDDYAVLFLQGGASTQFATLPMNYARCDERIGFVASGHWARKAMAEAERQREVAIVETVSADGQRQRTPSPDRLAYVHCTSNETVDGLRLPGVPETDGAPLICDMSSDILSRPVDVQRYGVIYAGAQKNLGPAGLTLVIVRRELLERCPDALLSHRRMADSGSMANTPPTFAWYVCDQVFRWIEGQGGLDVLGERNAAKAAALYAHIDGSGFYRNDVALALRSDMNVVFTPVDERHCAAFVDEAEAAGLIGLKGHRAVGGLRASLYNAMPLDGVEALIQFMDDFERRHG